MCNKINKDFKAFIPSVWTIIDKLQGLNDINTEGISDIRQDIKDTNFTVNIARNDVKLLKQYIKTQGIDDISKLTS